MNRIAQTLDEWLMQIGMNSSGAHWMSVSIMMIGFVIISFILYRIARAVINKYLMGLIRRTSFSWDDVLAEYRVFGKLAHLVPVFLFRAFVPIIFADFPSTLPFIQKLADAYLILVVSSIFIATLRAGEFVVSRQEAFKDKPISSYFQLMRIVLYIIVGILVLSLLLGKSPLYFLSAFGAMTAILMLVFKDTILGLVASVQISSNDMVRVGDWVEMPKFNADGDVLAINLNTVKVQNFDRTITTIPTYYFITDSFKNWRGMQESGGRRIKRALYINLQSVHFASEKSRKRFEEFTLIGNYLNERQKEIEQYNSKQKVNTAQLINGRRMTNLGIFRKYIEYYLKQHPRIAQHMTILVRQLPSEPKGVPIEIYCFTNTTNWLEFEEIVADIFDHLIAAAPYFEIDLFQETSGKDVQQLGQFLATAEAKSY